MPLPLIGILDVKLDVTTRELLPIEPVREHWDAQLGESVRRRDLGEDLAALARRLRDSENITGPEALLLAAKKRPDLVRRYHDETNARHA